MTTDSQQYKGDPADMTRETLVVHILMMKYHDPDYARYALAWYADLLPWLRLNDGVRAALEAGE